ncbi:MAG: DUF3857 domain-containing protein [Paracoccaceae bacterium]
MCRLFALVVLLVWPLNSVAQELLRADPPDWVSEAEIPEAAPALLAASRDGVFYPLVDTQIAWDGQTRLSHFRMTTMVTDRAGLERAATVSSDFDPSFETLTLTRLDVVRDGTVISYRDKLESEVFRRETQLEGGIIDGTLTAHLQVPDLRVGDVVDVAFLTAREPLVEGATRAAQISLEYGVPVGVTRHVVLWPRDWPLHIGTLPDRVIHDSAEANGVIRHEWRREGHIPPPDEEQTPVEALRDAILRYGAWADWAPLAAALSPYYLADYPLPPTWEAKVEAIRAAHKDDLSRATEVLRLVQDEIRYVGIEVGAGGYFARPPTTVAMQGFGDCKDKALLLRVLLARLGIASYPALADLDEGYGLNALQPALFAFDHMILRIDIGGRSYWVDPTGSHEGGRLDVAEPPGYGYALPLTGPGQRALQQIDVTGAPGWQSRTTERYTFTPLGVFLRVKSEFLGSYANRRRYRWATEPHDEIGRGFLNFYALKYPGIRETVPVTQGDDREANVVTVEENYFLPSPALFENGLREDFLFEAEDFGDYYPDRQFGKRETPLTAGGPKSHHHTVEVTGAPIDFRAPDGERIANPAFVYTFNGDAAGSGKLKLEWTFKTRGRVIPPEAVAGVVADARRIGRTIGFSWDLTPDPDLAAD